jgi:conjugal transfer pilus assembly protein TraK
MLSGKQPPRHPALAISKFSLIAEYRGSSLLGKVIRLTNKSAETLNITESDIAPRDSVAVSLATSTLKAGASTTAYLVGANAETQND